MSSLPEMAPDPATQSSVDPLRVLVTGAGGPAAVSFMRAGAMGPVSWFGVDLDPYAAGLYLVEPGRGALVPPGDADDFVDVLLERCREWAIDVLVPTVDVELLPIARRRDEFEQIGTNLVLAPASALEVCLDKWTLALECSGVVRVPWTTLLDQRFDPSGWDLPLVVKPRRGSGSRGIRIIDSLDALAECPRSDALIVQEHLPGEEYSIDVLTRADGVVVAAVPRERLKVDSGIAVAARTICDPELEDFGRAVAETVGVRGLSNVQCRRDRHGRLALLEVNPRVPGTLPITIASGVDAPAWLLAEAVGGEMPAHLGHREVAVVRHWEEHYVDPAHLRTFERATASLQPGGA